MKKAFLAIDTDGSGTIDIKELDAVFGDRENKADLIKLLSSADTAKTGQIEYTEFLAATMDHKVFLRDDYLYSAFKMFDKDGTGKLN